MTEDLYALAGVDPAKITVFKDLMRRICKETSLLARSGGAEVHTGLKHGHGGVFRVGTGPWQCTTLEGPGNLPWLAALMYHIDRTLGLEPKPYHIVSGITSVMMAANDCMAQGARPVTCLDLVAANNSDWFASPEAADLGRGIGLGCEMSKMALVAGESPSMRHIINGTPPAVNAPDVAIAVTGVVVQDDHLVTGERLGPGSAIVGLGSSGVHGNGWSLIIKQVLERHGPAGFDKKLTNGKRLGEELLAATRCYVSPICQILDAGVRPHALLPGTGDGIAKLASDKRELTYHIDYWPELLGIFKLLHVEFGIPWETMLTTFNMGVGYYVFVDPGDVDAVIYIARQTGCPAWRLGVVAEGPRGVDHHPYKLWIPPKA